MSNLNESLNRLKVVEKILSSNASIEEIPAIEFDIVMSKLRDVYAELLANRNGEVLQEQENSQAGEIEFEPIVGIEVKEIIEQEKVDEPQPVVVEFEPLVQIDPIDESEFQPQIETVESPQNNVKAIDPLFEDIDNDIIEQLYGSTPTSREIPVEVLPEPEPQPEPAPATEPEPQVVDEPVAQPKVQSPLNVEKRVLGEVLKSDAEVLNTTLGGGVQRDLASKIVAGTDLRTQIGINDRFMFIRELFNNNETLYEQTLNELNKETDLDEALIYIGENFRWRGDSAAAQQFINMLIKKLS